ncbi:MAG: Smr/MutS family protein [Saprospiraceae bacterium]|nr:Smr/MutS family protein [Saprospiraceae bacterium]
MEKVDINSLWIGDLVTLHSNGTIGTFEGEQDGLAKINVDGRIIFAHPTDLRLHSNAQSENEGDLDDIEDPSDTQTPVAAPANVIDLHLDKWPSYKPSSGIPALDFQMRQCAHFVDSAIEQRLTSIVIIHGKGAGVLKTNVRHLLSLKAEVFQIHDIHAGGALEVILHYREGEKVQNKSRHMP